VVFLSLTTTKKDMLRNEYVKIKCIAVAGAEKEFPCFFQLSTPSLHYAEKSRYLKGNYSSDLRFLVITLKILSGQETLRRPFLYNCPSGCHTSCLRDELFVSIHSQTLSNAVLPIQGPSSVLYMRTATLLILFPFLGDALHTSRGLWPSPSSRTVRTEFETASQHINTDVGARSGLL